MLHSRATLLRVFVPMFAVFSMLAGCDAASTGGEASRPAAELIVLTPHSSAITNAFSVGFSRSYYARHKQAVAVHFIQRGTPQCVAYLDSAFGAAGESGSRVPDVMFGGGIVDHRYLKERGYSRKLDIAAAVKDIPETVAGLPTRDADGHWYGTGLSSFGIFYNAAACAARGIEPPKTWADLGDPRFAGWIGVADPNVSGSTRECLALIAQSMGWEPGWTLITEILANARGISRSSSEALDGVESGIFLASFAVNFEGLRRASRAPDRFAYVNPMGATAVSPDVISVMNTRGATAIAKEFVEYVLSAEGQLIWAGNAAQNPAGEDPLFHYAIVPQVIEGEAAKLAVAENPFKTDFGIQFDLARSERETRVLRPLIAALCEGSHIPLQMAWRDAIVAGRAARDRWPSVVSPPLKAADLTAVAEKLGPIGSESERALRAEWAAYFVKQLKSPQITGQDG